jgi:KDO2-lipid IV(A) lauroyltransferase
MSKHYLEYILARGFWGLMGILPMRIASHFGAWLGGTIGPHIKRSNLALAQMAQHLPQLSIAEREAALLAMWRHLGRMLTEYPHLAAGHLDVKISISGQEHMRKVQQSGKPALFVSGHFGHWELVPKALAMCGMPLHIVYRPPNNKLVDKLIHKIRTSYTLGHYGKGSDGAKGILAAIKRGESVAMLVDQKDNTGAPIPFLGSDAMTMLSAAKLALKYKLPIIPVRALRLEGCNFHIDLSAPLPLPPENLSNAEREIALMTQINQLLGDWIRAAPGQWFWLHRRWPK